MKLLSKRESGQALILALVLLLIGGLMLPPLLSFISTGLKSSQLHEQKTDELYAADAGVEDAIYNILYLEAPHYDELSGLDENVCYPLPQQQVNGQLVDVKVTKLSLIEGLDDEAGPHEPWWSIVEQIDYGEGWVECHITITYTGVGIRRLETVGAFFAPFPGDMDLSPYDIEYTLVMTSDDLEDGSPETKVASGGFAFIWKWQENKGPCFNPPLDNTGAVSFKFTILDPDWSYDCFLWATIRQQDGSLVTNAPGLNKWLIEATAGDTTVRSVAIGGTGAVNILTWEINPPG